MKSHGLRRVFAGNWLGNRRFWDVVDAVAKRNAEAGRPYKSDAQWQHIFAAAEGCDLPEFVWRGLARQQALLDESAALGRTAEDRYRDELAMQREKREAAVRVAPVYVAAERSSRGRKRTAVAERDEV